MPCDLNFVEGHAVFAQELGNVEETCRATILARNFELSSLVPTLPTMLVGYLVTVLTLPLAAAFETWHLVDVAQVVCPAPTVSAGAPTLPPYNVGINYTSAMVVDAPHIVSFLRTSNKAMTITFKIEDANGAEVVPQTTVNLEAISSTVPSTCACHLEPGEAECGDLWGNLTVGAWCCRSWCYASSDCPDAYSSYAACNSVPAPSTCKWTDVAKANDPCKCKNVGSLFNSAMKNKFALNYGESCGAWDMQNCATNYRPDQVDTWCCASWCYVDKACPSARDSLNDGMQGILYWTDNACPDDTALTLQCPYRRLPSTEDPGDCTCLTDLVPESVMDWAALDLNETTYAEYGTYCAPWDSQERAPYAPPTVSPRRRSYTAPTAYDSRRRSTYSSTSTPRRRASSYSTPRRRAARRRAPPPPAPAPVNTRRRSSSINGQTSLGDEI
eukprot:Skav217325  [mRNA]  locus=scaffold2460:9588:27216:- [translate_table: standard]